MTRHPREQAEAIFRRNLAPLLALGEEHADAEEIFVDGDRIRLSFGDWKRTYTWSDFPGLDEGAIQAAAQNAAVFAEQEFGSVPPARSLISVKMPPDLRVTFAAPPAAARWHARVRFLRSHRFTLADYVAAEIMSPSQADAIRELVAPKDGSDPRNLIVSGGVMTGKTTLLRALLAELDPALDLCVIEDTPELSLPGENVAFLQTTLNHDLADLLRHTLRMSPDRIILGEVRGPEALELVTAMNTGHPGCMCTLHSDGASLALRRLHIQCRKAMPTLPYDEIEATQPVVLQLRGRGKSRKLVDIYDPMC